MRLEQYANLASCFAVERLTDFFFFQIPYIDVIEG